MTGDIIDRLMALEAVTANEESETLSDAADAIVALRARNAELEREVLDQCRLNGMGGEREARLMARVAELERALEPFSASAAIINKIPLYACPRHDQGARDYLPASSPTIGDLHRARSVLHREAKDDQA